LRFRWLTAMNYTTSLVVEFANLELKIAAATYIIRLQECGARR
jgi:hypothetical protein